MSSFIKRGKAQPAGVKINAQGIACVRTGVASLDSILQGGLLCHSVVFIEDDALTHHGLHLGRCFMGEGSINSELSFVYSDRQEDAKQLVPDARPGKTQKASGLRIAWRYEDFPATSSMQEPYFFDLSKPNAKPLPNLRITQIEASERWCSELWNQIVNDTSESLTGSDDKSRRRLWIKSLLSPLLPLPSLSELYHLLNALRTLVRSLDAVLLITCPVTHLSPQAKALLQHMSDMYIEINSLPVAFAEYTGILTIKKAPTLHTVKPQDIESRQFGIKLETKKISVEALQLPPADFTKNTVETLEF
mmetsp:Transcript_3572/g.7670  ORF Transcript_3572/g.7670 Transcript_3572/m.7670 type:complete len:305 (+) Transcript_3572:1306-2220(+)